MRSIPQIWFVVLGWILTMQGTTAAYGSEHACFDTGQTDLIAACREPVRFAAARPQIAAAVGSGVGAELVAHGWSLDLDHAVFSRVATQRLALVPLQGPGGRSLFGSAAPPATGAPSWSFLVQPLTGRSTVYFFEFEMDPSQGRIERLSIATESGYARTVFPARRKVVRGHLTALDSSEPPAATPECAQCVADSCLAGLDWCTWAMTLVLNCDDCWSGGVCGDCYVAIAQAISCKLFECEECNEPCVDVLPPQPGGQVQVPAGQFVMGDGVARCGVDRRQVTLTHDFSIGQIEVTTDEYLTLLQWAYDQGYVTATVASVTDNVGSTVELVDLDDEHCEITFDPVLGIFASRQTEYALQWAYPEGYDPSRHPVKEVTWYGAAAYCDWLSLSSGIPQAYDHETWACGPGGNPYRAEGYRLPTDAEWEYVSRYQDQRIYPWGDTEPDCDLANFFYNGDYCVRWTAPVASREAGAQPNHRRPIYDLAGNVWEWVNDYYECNLGTSPITDPHGPPHGDARIRRGGGWGDAALGVRSAGRYRELPDGAYYNVGFRIARSQ